MQNILICPYCQSTLLIKSSKGFGIAKCSCDLYPVIEGIIFLQKNDLKTNNVLVSLIKEKKYLTTVWTALSTSSLIHRIVTFSFYLILKKFKINLPFSILLFVLKILGPSKSWFSYLVNRQQIGNLSIAVKQFRDTGDSEVVIDVGCGIGHFIKELQNATDPKTPIIIGIDKNFLTLFMATMFLTKKPVLICSNIEDGFPITNHSANRVLFLDSFAWIFGKSRVLNDAGRVLKKRGHLSLINIFPATPKTKPWGYGIASNKLRLLLHNNFNYLVYTKNSRDSKDLGFSMWARKK